MIYTIRKASQEPTLKGLWDVPPWSQAETLEIRNFHPKSSKHHPVTRTRLLYTEKGLYVFFRVEDRYVRAIATKYQDSVCNDSCVEFFVEPKPGKGYLNFEINCGGTMLLYFIEDSTPVPGKGFARFRPVEEAVGSKVQIHHSLPRQIQETMETPVTWFLEYFVPFTVFEEYVGSVRPVSGATWRANFYKCGGDPSHLHWGSWAPIGEPLNFHKPERFAPIRFE